MINRAGASEQNVVSLTNTSLSVFNNIRRFLIVTKSLMYTGKLITFLKKSSIRRINFLNKNLLLLGSMISKLYSSEEKLCSP